MVIKRVNGLPTWCNGKGSTCQCNRFKRFTFELWVREDPWSRKWQSIPGFLPGEFHGLQSLVGYCPWDHKESDTTKQMSMHTQEIKP